MRSIRGLNRGIAVFNRMSLRVVLTVAAFLTCGLVYSQALTGSNFVCSGKMETYTYDAGTTPAACGPTWTVLGGEIFDSNGTDQGTSFLTTVDFSGKSIIKVKWGASNLNASVSVAGGNCSGGDATINSIIVNGFPVSVSASPSTIAINGTTTLTASSSPYTATYAWSAPGTGHLNSTSGASVTATANATTTFTCTGTSVFTLNFGAQTATCTQTGTVAVHVTVPPISGNAICCSQCIPTGTVPAAMTQETGTSLTGGNGTTFLYQWQKSTDAGAHWANVTTGTGANSATYTPAALTVTTVFKRIVSETGVTAVNGNELTAGVATGTLNPSITATTYSANTTSNGFGTMTITGNQTASTGVLVNFVAEDKIVINPTTTLSGSFTLSNGSLCPPPAGGRIAAVIDSLDTVKAVTIKPMNIPDTDVASSFGDGPFPSSYSETLGAYPNPSATGTVTINYTVKQNGFISLSLMDEKGNVTGTIINRRYSEPGDYQTSLATHSIPPGVYFYRLVSADRTETKRLVILSK